MPENLPPVRAITRGPGFHWFAYYDKLEFDPSGRYVLAMEVDFEHRSPRPDDVIKVGMVDLEDGDRWIELGETRAWCWQQGCMLQWRPGSESEGVWNDRQGDDFVCHIMDVKTRRKRTIPFPVYALSADGRIAVSLDFRRVNNMRPGYGYTGLPDPNEDVFAPEDSGIWRVDLETGRADLIISIAQIAGIPYPHGDISGSKHYFNHLLFNPDGSRFIFLNRWGPGGGQRWGTRMFTGAPDGSDVRIVADSGMTSHFIWRDPTHILAWSRDPSNGDAFYVYEDGTRRVEPVGLEVMTSDGHCSYLPGAGWVLNDSYPREGRRQRLYLYDVAAGERIVLGEFPSPEPYSGEWRCDLHPRHSPDGRRVVIDSAHGGNGRQVYVLDVSAVVA